MLVRCISVVLFSHYFLFFFFNDTATTEIYTLSLHDALPISSTATSSSRPGAGRRSPIWRRRNTKSCSPIWPGGRDRKSTRLNSSHGYISYAVFCLKKKKNKQTTSKSSWTSSSFE